MSLLATRTGLPASSSHERSSEFDCYPGDSYAEAVGDSIAFVGREHRFFLEAKVDALVALAARRLGDPEQLRFVDVGCGVGLMDELLARRVGGLAGVDVSAEAVESAATRNPGVHYAHASGTALPFSDASFNGSFAVCVLHHVPQADRRALVAEMARVTCPGGLVVIFEHNPLHPLTRLAVARCPFDADAELLGPRAVRALLLPPLQTVETRYLLFSPWRLPRLPGFLSHLSRAPFGAQYFVAAERTT